MAKKTTKRKTTAPKPKPKCGLVMPIASTPNCTESHWREVKEIFVSALKSKFETELVSEEPEVDVIQSKIVNNLYDNPLVVVDVSELNPNVMFELGLRLAFDKPTVLIKDYETDWKFDISPLETLTYPRDLRHSKIEAFKKNLLKKALATHEKREAEGESYSQYLKHFKKLERKTIETEQVGDVELILERLNGIEAAVASRAGGAITRLSRSKRRGLSAGGTEDQFAKFDSRSTIWGFWHLTIVESGTSISSPSSEVITRKYSFAAEVPDSAIEVLLSFMRLAGLTVVKK